MLTPEQLRAARAIARWSREKLAQKAKVSEAAIRNFEISGADSKFTTLQRLRRALEGAGIEFIEAADGKGAGVRLRADGPKKRG